MEHIININDIAHVNRQTQLCVLDNGAQQNILLIGSCRIMPLLNYLISDEYFGNNYNYLCILVYIPEMVELSIDIINNEYTDLRNQIANSSILFCEYIKNYNYFNTDTSLEKNIFQLHSLFETIISLPNFQDPCIYSVDIILYKNLKEEFHQLIKNEITIIEFTKKIKEIQNSEKDRYYNVIQKSDIPDLLHFVKDNVNCKRIAYVYNHPTNMLFIKMYELIVNKFFNRNVSEQVMICNNRQEFLSNTDNRKLTFYDKHCLGFTINEEYLNEEDSNEYILNLLEKY
jgi:hypothetical protein